MFQAVCTEAGMFALRERRQHVTQEDFEMAVAKVTIGRNIFPTFIDCSCTGYAQGRGQEHESEAAVQVKEESRGFVTACY